jgi:hypothetical protein
VRKKPPVLTSPGKVGFLVALLLVVTALGVSYFISGTFGLQWKWLEIGGGSSTGVSFDFGAFVDEMVPLIALVSLLAFASHVLVAGAVRRYKSTVDTGSDFRDLLRSFRNLDFDDEERLEELKQHPELREFVMGIRNRVAARERQQVEREKRHEAPSRSSGDRGSAGFASECSVLLGAIVDGKDGFGRDLALTIPELKQIERALRERLAQKPVDHDAPKRELEALRATVDSTMAAVRGGAAAARRDAGACVTGAREIEAMLNSVKQSIEALAVPTAVRDGVAVGAKRVDAVAESMATLGEETKRVAIAAALQASGAGPGDDPIKVADEIRTIATKFNAVAQQWREASPPVKSAIETVARGTANAEARREAALTATDAVVAKTRLWVERLVALADQVHGLARASGDTTSPVKSPVAEPAQPWDDLERSLREDTAPDAEVPIMERAGPKPVVGKATASDLDDDFVTQRAANVFEESQDEDAQFADIPGFEKDRHLFTDDAGKPVDHAEHEADPRFVVEREAGAEWDLARATEAHEVAQNLAHGTPSTPLEDDGFLTGPGKTSEARPTVAPPKTSGKKTKRIPVKDIDHEDPKPARAPVATKADPDADAIDLYALGAVDWTADAAA